MSKDATRSGSWRLRTGTLAVSAALLLSGPVEVFQQTPTPPQTPPPIGDLGPRGVIRTIVIDPGHGGDDEGVHGLAGTKEKDVVLQFARRLKAALEARFESMKVLLTRDGDTNVSIESRTTYANSQRADLLLSLHANASVRPELRGIEVFYISPDDYRDRMTQLNPRPQALPVASGGTRFIEPVPADVAQLAVAEKSKTLGATLVKQLGDRSVSANAPLTSTAPLRLLIGASMPSALIELGFLTNAEDEAALVDAAAPTAIVEAIVDAIAELRLGFPGIARNR